MKKIFPLFAGIFFLSTTYGQKKVMTPDVYNLWNKISDTHISHEGQWVAYTLSTEVGNITTILYNTRDKSTTALERSSSPSFDAASDHLIVWKKPDYEQLRKLKLKDTKKDDLPGDSLLIYDLDDMTYLVFTDVKRMEVPDKWGSHVIMHLEDQKMKKEKEEGYVKKENKENGTKLLIADLKKGKVDTIHYVTGYELSEESPGLAFVTNGLDSVNLATVHLYSFKDGNSKAITTENGKYTDIAFSEDGNHLAFIADMDTTDAPIRPFELMLSMNMGMAQSIINDSHPVIPEGMMVSEFRKPRFSSDNQNLYFGISPQLLVKDTTKLDEELPGVEVWYTDTPMLYTMQENQSRRLKEENYLAVHHISDGNTVALADKDCPDINLSEDANEQIFIGFNSDKYQKAITWMGSSNSDLYIINGSTGKKMKVLNNVPGRLRISPAGKYGIWYNRIEGQYYTLSPSEKEPVNVTASIPTSLADELNDRPMDPSPYGIMGWTDEDEFILIYDRYDIWKVDPSGQSTAQNLTNGRKDKIQYRYIDLDREEESINLQGEMLLYVFDEDDKTSGYAKMKNGQAPMTILKTPHTYSRRVWKAKNSNNIVYTREDFDEFPDLVLSDVNFKDPVKISNANPQQKEYLWGSGEVYEWEDEMGVRRTGMLFVPEGFDPNKKYPMLVNFYERSSNGIYRHRAPFAHRSTINYTYYLSKGFVIFNPDVHYEIGYPGRSAFNASVSGTKSLIEKGFIDEDRIGLQGHSWGGYQIAHILTKTDMFACAESGAPVVNMISAYGGIRWGSGMSRMFQYEKTQSRLGKTLWENPGLYMENSPIFHMDKVNTPVLILHNDEDTAVPWYQGIEYFMALRRLNKPAWLLNYNNEPHWPLKWPNRLDFNKRMEQFFDHFLLNKPMPEWMKEGIPAHQKKTNLGY